MLEKYWKLPELRENLILYMAPQEEADERDTIVEIRAGTGGKTREGWGGKKAQRSEKAPAKKPASKSPARRKKTTAKKPSDPSG